jgi:hypothetical protein
MSITEIRDGIRKATHEEVIALAAHLNQEYDYELLLSADPEDLVEEIEKEVDIEDLLEAYETVILKVDDAEEPEDGSGADSDDDGEDGDGGE